MSRWLILVAVLALLACGESSDPIDTTHSGAGASSASSSASSGGGAGGNSSASTGGAGGGVSQLDSLLDALRSDVHAAMLAQSNGEGWPAPVEGGALVVSTDPALDRVAGDHDGWSGTAMNSDQGFSWLVLPLGPGSHYKLTDTTTFVADPWSRAYEHDSFGEMSMTAPATAHLERYFEVSSATIAPRTVRVWVPEQAPTHVLYLHDGQNLFDPDAPWGGWQIQDSVPPAMLLVGIDNTADRFDEYTHVQDDIGMLVGGNGDAYADFVDSEVRALVATHYGEPDRVGVMGSSLGGLISLHIAQRHPGEYDFAASMSGTLGWGSIGLSGGAQNETLIERHQSAGHQGTAIFIDSGGGGSCFDSDGDGIEDDDPNASDNYCETAQLAGVLDSVGYTTNGDTWYWYESGALHNEAAWGSRVFRPLGIFAGL